MKTCATILETANITNDNSTESELTHWHELSGTAQATNYNPQTCFRRIYVGFLLQKSRFDPISVHVGSVINIVFLRMLRFIPVDIFPPMLHVPLSIYYLHCKFLVVGIVINRIKGARFDVYDLMSWKSFWRTELSETGLYECVPRNGF
jgi:hypothetical protein